MSWLPVSACCARGCRAPRCAARPGPRPPATSVGVAGVVERVAVGVAAQDRVRPSSVVDAGPISPDAALGRATSASVALAASWAPVVRDARRRPRRPAQRRRRRAAMTGGRGERLPGALGGAALAGRRPGGSAPVVVALKTLRAGSTVGGAGRRATVASSDVGDGGGDGPAPTGDSGVRRTPDGDLRVGFATSRVVPLGDWPAAHVPPVSATWRRVSPETWTGPRGVPLRVGRARRRRVKRSGRP